jgi:hypothetical protein
MAPTLATYTDVLRRVSEEVADAVSSSEALINEFIEDVERTIVAETRRDWVDSYSDVNVNVKETLRTATASKAAELITTKHMAAEFSRAAAITNINVNLNEFNRTLKALQDLDITKIRKVVN